MPRTPLISTLLLMSCGLRGDALDVDAPPGPAQSAPAESAGGPAPAAPAAAAPDASQRAKTRGDFEAFQDDLGEVFEQAPKRRVAIQVDKPLYKPGETIWFRALDLRDRDLAGEGAGGAMDVQLINPKGASTLKLRLQAADGAANNAFDVPAEAPGGRYLIRVVRGDETVAERPVIVNRYEAPRIKKKLEFVRKAYGPGDTVSATVEVERAGGEPLADQELLARVHLDGRDLDPVRFRTNGAGEGLVRFDLPDAIDVGDGLLTVLVEDGGITESVSKRVPIIVNRLDMQLFPEGGDLVRGLPGRVYFEAKNPLGKPADVEGRVVDDRGQEVATFASLRDGRGRFEFTPEKGRAYRAEITKPEGVASTFDLPAAKRDGCVLRHYDDFDGELAAIRVGVRCSEARTVDVQAALRGQILDGASVQAPAGGEAVVYLASGDDAADRAQGVARVTVFDGRAPLAERLVYRNRRQSLRVEVTPDKEAYGPRERVTLKVVTRDASGEPVPARLAMSVVDDTVLSYADDKRGHLMAQLYLERELQDEVHEPNWYFDLEEADGAEAMDHLMGTRGWRRFDWAQAATMPAPAPDTGIAFGEGLDALRVVRGAMAVPEPEAAAPPPPAVAAPAAPVEEKPMAQPAPVPEPAEAQAQALAALGYLGDDDAGDVAAGFMADEMMIEEDLEEEPLERWGNAGAGRVAAKEMKKIANWDDFDDDRRQAVVWAPVRVFPAKTYEPGYEGPRVDFRETLHWAPEVTTGDDGAAELSFFTSDAITSFRVTTEGVGAGLAGRDEAVFKSSLPFSMSVKLPVAVSEGDVLDLPLTFTNETDRALSVGLQADFGDQVKVLEGAGGEVDLAAAARDTRDFKLEVTGRGGEVKVAFAADAAGLADAFTRSLTVSPLGFPQTWEASGEADGKHRFTIDLGEAVEGTVQASVQLYPSPLSTMVEGMEGLLREPSGCFEQTSSSNYPNVMVMNYLEENDAVAPEIMERSRGLMERGYRKLVGYETSEKGYEWFGSTPAHEALTAYGLVEFVDMARVYPEVDQSMIERTRAYLLSRRDGEGGFKRDAKALDSFGRAAPEVTDAYITWSLAEAGETGMKEELDRTRALAAETGDAYLLALAANTLLELDPKAGRAAVGRLKEMQGDDGAWTNADHSITRSGGSNLHIETTSLAVLALVADGGHDAEVRAAVKWLNENRGGFGQWGATQATVLSLRAMTAYASASRVTRGSGSVIVSVNGKKVGRFSYEAGHQGTIEFSDFGAFFTAGENTLVLEHEGEHALPFSAAVEYRSEQPATAPEVAVSLETALAAESVGMGENVRMTATLVNRTDEGLPMTVARVGLPGGLAAQTWQLEELRESGVVDFYETGAREVIVYFRELSPKEEVAIPLDLVAEVPGSYTAPASSAWLYYQNDMKWWTEGEAVTITR